MTRFTGGVAALALLAGLGIAAAQQAPQSTTGATNPSEQTPERAEQQPRETTAGRPSTAPPADHQQGQSENAMHSKSGQGGKEEPSSHAPTEKPMDTAVFIDGRLAAPGAAADTQTVPAKFSERNAALDALPIMAMPLGLTDAQRRLIYESVSETKPAAAEVTAKSSDLLPQGIETRELPQKITDEIAAVRGLKYTKLENKVLLVVGSNRIVVGVIEK